MTHTEHVGGIEIRIDGAPLDPTVASRLLDARVQDDLLLPDALELRFRDPEFELVDGALMDVGKQVEVRVSSALERGPAVALFNGKIASLAPEFEADGCLFVVRGFDASHALNRVPRSRTFQDMTASDIASKVIGEAGLLSDVQSTRDVSAFEQQSNETDWMFLWRLAARSGYTLSCLGTTVHFGEPGRGAAAPTRLEWGVNLRSFHPRATGVQQYDEVEVSGWDPATAQRITATAQRPKLDSSIGLDRARVSDAAGGGQLAVADRILTTQGEATAFAQSTLDHVANAWLEAEGTVDGDPRLRAGTKIDIVGVGQRFGGQYLITGATHVVRGGAGYETRFRISGRARRALLDLLTPVHRPGYGESLVIGVVTNVDDPESQNRVRVKYPALDDQHEGGWARIASLAASGDRGVMMMPLVGDEVVVGFEQGDERRPLVLGSLWNGSSPPGGLILNTGGQSGSPSDGSFNLSSQKAVTVRATEELDLKGKSLKLATDQATEFKAQGNTKLESSGAVDIKGAQSVTVKGDGSVTIESTGTVKLTGASIEVSATGPLKLAGATVMIG